MSDPGTFTTEHSAWQWELVRQTWPPLLLRPSTRFGSLLLTRYLSSPK